MVAETVEKQRKINELLRKAAKLGRKGRRGQPRKVIDERGSLPFQRSSTKWTSLPKKMCGNDGALLENLYWIFTFEPYHNLHLVMSILLRTCLTQFLSSNDTSSHPEGPSRK